jgi:hypothetical protein
MDNHTSYPHAYPTQGAGRNSGKNQDHFPYNTVNVDQTKGAPSYDQKHPDWTIVLICFLSFTILNHTAITPQSKVPAFLLCFDHFTPQTLADTPLKHLFPTWLESSIITMKPIVAKGKHLFYLFIMNQQSEI